MEQPSLQPSYQTGQEPPILSSLGLKPAVATQKQQQLPWWLELAAVTSSPSLQRSVHGQPQAK